MDLHTAKKEKNRSRKLEAGTNGAKSATETLLFPLSTLAFCFSSMGQPQVQHLGVSWSSSTVLCGLVLSTLLLQVRTDIRDYGLIELPSFTACASFLDLRSSRRPWKRPRASTYSHLIQPRQLTLGLSQYGQVSVEQPRAIH